MTTEDDHDNVVGMPLPKPQEIRPKGTAELRVVVNQYSKRPRCAHNEIEIDEQQRRVYCDTCKVELDTFGTFLRFTRDYQRAWNDLQSLRRDVVATRSRLELLKRLEANTKSRLRRAISVPTDWHMERLLQYVWALNPKRDATAEDIEHQLDFSTPQDRFAAAAEASKRGFGWAALAFAEQAVAELRAGLEAREEQKDETP